jgi:hypothetical protein
MVLERHELLIESAGEQEVGGMSRSVSVTEARIASLKFGHSRRPRPRVDYTRQVSQVVRDRRRQRQRRSGWRAAIEGLGKGALLAIELSVDLQCQRHGLVVEAERDVLISHALWQQRYALSPDTLGRSITINGTPHTVVGVMPAALSHVALRRGLLGTVDLWMPLPPARDELRDRRDLRVVARLAPGVSPEALRARLDGVAQAREPS